MGFRATKPSPACPAAASHEGYRVRASRRTRGVRARQKGCEGSGGREARLGRRPPLAVCDEESTEVKLKSGTK